MVALNNNFVNYYRNKDGLLFSETTWTNPFGRIYLKDNQLTFDEFNRVLCTLLVDGSSSVNPSKLLCINTTGTSLINLDKTISVLLTTGSEPNTGLYDTTTGFLRVYDDTSLVYRNSPFHSNGALRITLTDAEKYYFTQDAFILTTENGLNLTVEGYWS